MCMYLSTLLLYYWRPELCDKTRHFSGLLQQKAATHGYREIRAGRKIKSIAVGVFTYLKKSTA